MISIEQARKLTHGTTIYSTVWHNSDGSAQRWRINGQMKTWKTKPLEYRIPIKHGLYAYDYLTDANAHMFSLTDVKEARAKVVA